MAQANTCEWEKGDKGICDICGKEGKIAVLWYYPTFMNGDAEVEMKACVNDHAPEKNKAYQKLKKEIGPSEKEREWQQKRNHEARISEQVEELEQAGYTVRRLNSIYQVRVNNRLDLYPVSQSYHDIKANKRGSYYKKMLSFVEEFFK